jgi:hypothetical protein
MRVRTNDGKEGTIVERKTNQVLVKFNNGLVKGYRPEQVQEIGTPANSLKPPSRERDTLISKYQTMLDECRNDGAKAVLVMILNDFK